MSRGPQVLYVCHRFPWITQSFTSREVALLRAHGVDVEVLAFKRPTGPLDEQSRSLLEITHVVPAPWTRAFLAVVARVAVRRPAGFLRLVALGLGSRYLSHTDARLRARGLLDVLRGAYAAGAFRGVSHFHAEFADNACTAAMAAAELSGRTFSFKSHSSFNPQALERKSEHASLVVLENEFDRRRYFARVPADRLFLNRGGVVLAESPPREDGGAALRVLCVGTLQEKKGQLVLVAALSQLAARGIEFSATLVGSGPLEGRIRAEVAAAGLEGRVRLQPYLPHDEVLALYAEHDVFALPCVVAANADRDGLPNVLIEAAAAGCVIVSTPVSGIPELVEDGASGLLVPERDPMALADALERLAADPALRDRLRRGARAVVSERFDLARNVAELAAQLRRLAAPPG